MELTFNTIRSGIYINTPTGFSWENNKYSTTLYFNHLYFNIFLGRGICGIYISTPTQFAMGK